MLWLAALWGAAGFVADYWLPDLGPAWTVAGLAAGSIALLDFLWLRLEKAPTAERELPEFLALGSPQEIPLRIINPLRRSLYVEVYDGVPPTCETEGLPWAGRIQAGGFVEAHYRAIPMARGPQEFADVHLLMRSILTLWRRQVRRPLPGKTRVYPNFQPVLRFNLLAMSNRAAQMGIRSLNRPGQSREFRQLREFQDSDPLNRIDWKATSRRLSLISRQYEEQRDQTIILAVDCGRRMMAMDGDLPQFDHCLNAMLLLSYIALRQGDAVGILGLGEDARWLPPQKGPSSMPALLSHLYDYQAGRFPLDMAEGVRVLMARQKRRALVIFLTNLRSEDSEHIIEPLRTLRRKHLVLAASLCEEELLAKLRSPARSFADALTITSGQLYMEERAGLFTRLEQAGIMTLDCSAKELPAALANRYLEIKKAGSI